MVDIFRILAYVDFLTRAVDTNLEQMRLIRDLFIKLYDEKIVVFEFYNGIEKEYSSAFGPMLEDPTNITDTVEMRELELAKLILDNKKYFYK
uniref:CRISPR-associated endonuclease Cas2 n=1 Tax=Caenorhabditis tropicalis TaxID=1561998 RepID=A0A1I7UQV7_9PELO